MIEILENYLGVLYWKAIRVQKNYIFEGCSGQNGREAREIQGKLVTLSDR